MDSELIALLQDEYRDSLAYELQSICDSKGNGWSQEAVFVATQLLHDRASACRLELEDARIMSERRAREDAARAHDNFGIGSALKFIVVLVAAIGLASLRSQQRGSADPKHDRLRKQLEDNDRSVMDKRRPQAAGTEWEKLQQEATELYEKGKYDQAVLVAEKAVEVAEQGLGHDHPAVAVSLENLADMYRSTKRIDEAESLEKRAAKIRAATN